MLGLLILIGGGGGDVPIGSALSVVPGRIRPSSVTVVSFVGTGTAWLSSGPSLSASGLAGVSLGPVTVASDTLALASITTGPAFGSILWTDATSGLTATQTVGGGEPIIMLKPAPSRSR